MNPLATNAPRIAPLDWPLSGTKPEVTNRRSDLEILTSNRESGNYQKEERAYPSGAPWNGPEKHHTGYDASSFHESSPQPTTSRSGSTVEVSGENIAGHQMYNWSKPFCKSSSFFPVPHLDRPMPVYPPGQPGIRKTWPQFAPGSEIRDIPGRPPFRFMSRDNGSSNVQEEENEEKRANFGRNPWNSQDFGTAYDANSFHENSPQPTTSKSGTTEKVSGKNMDDESWSKSFRKSSSFFPDPHLRHPVLFGPPKYPGQRNDWPQFVPRSEDFGTGRFQDEEGTDSGRAPLERHNQNTTYDPRTPHKNLPQPTNWGKSDTENIFVKKLSSGEFPSWYRPNSPPNVPRQIPCWFGSGTFGEPMSQPMTRCSVPLLGPHFSGNQNRSASDSIGRDGTNSNAILLSGDEEEEEKKEEEEEESTLISDAGDSSSNPTSPDSPSSTSSASEDGFSVNKKPKISSLSWTADSSSLDNSSAATWSENIPKYPSFGEYDPTEDISTNRDTIVSSVSSSQSEYAYGTGSVVNAPKVIRTVTDYRRSDLNSQNGGQWFDGSSGNPFTQQTRDPFSGSAEAIGPQQDSGIISWSPGEMNSSELPALPKPNWRIVYTD